MKQPRRLLCVLVFFFCCQLPVSAGQASGFTRRDFAAAASATAMLPGSAAAPEREETFRADHPFLYIVLHRPTGAILFAGNVSNPR